MISPILPLYAREDLNFTHGTGMYLYTADGKQYLDMASGYAALALGHCHPKMVEALKAQAEKLWHLSNRYKIPGMLEYSKRIADNSFADTLFIANSGAEAVECMIKMARRYFNAQGKLDKFRIITIDGAFHGRTLACATAGSAEKIKGFEPPVQGFDRVPFDDIEALKAAITDQTAGVMIEPIQGEGGMRANTDKYMKELRKICDEHGILLMLDEVQCGMGRTGYLFAYEMYGINPDLVALGKGLGAGFPISACLATEKVGKAMLEGTHGSTFGGNPLAIAIGNVVLDEMLDKDFLPRVKKISEYLHKKLNEFAKKNADVVDKITGRGLICGIRFKKKIEVTKFSELCIKNQLLSIPASDNVMRITPALILTKEDVDLAIERFDKALADYKSPVAKMKVNLGKTFKKLKYIMGI